MFIDVTFLCSVFHNSLILLNINSATFIIYLCILQENWDGRGLGKKKGGTEVFKVKIYGASVNETEFHSHHVSCEKEDKPWIVFFIYVLITTAICNINVYGKLVEHWRANVYYSKCVNYDNNAARIDDLGSRILG